MTALASQPANHTSALTDTQAVALDRGSHLLSGGDGLGRGCGDGSPTGTHVSKAIRHTMSVLVPIL